jgi:pyruvate-ferredoxin/flavodoxin oxidoreductase
MIFKKKPSTEEAPRYPGIREALDGGTAIVEMETAASEGAGAYPITPSTQMGEGWAQAVASGKTNVNGRRLLFFEPEGEHAAAAVTAGMSMTGLRATNFSSGQGIAYMHESLYAAAGKRLTYVLNVAARAMTKHALNVHAGHDDYHAIDDTGFFQFFAKDVQSCADLNLIAHRVAELSLNPGVVAQDGFLTSHVIESMLLPERELVKEYLGDPSDMIESPTAAQRMVFGKERRRIPEMFDLDYPAMLGVVQNQDAYAQGVAAQRPFYFDHVREITDSAMAEYAALTGRNYARASGYRMDDAEYVLVGQGSVVANAEAVADHLRETRGLKIGVLDLTMFRPFPADLVTRLLRGKKGVTVLERVDQPLAVDPPLLREIRAAMSQALENGRAGEPLPYPGVASITLDETPDFYAAGFGFGSRDLQPGDLIAAAENMLPSGNKRRHFYLGIDFVRVGTQLPKLQLWQEELLEDYPKLTDLTLPSVGDIDLAPPDSIAIRIHSIGGWGAITTGKNIVLTAFELAGLHVKANPKYGSEKKGQPTTFYATLAHEPIRINAELKHVDVVLSPDPNVFRHSNPLAGLSEGGVFVIQSDRPVEEVWRSLPIPARRDVRERQLKVFAVDGFTIATEEASDPELRYRMQGAAFMGAFFASSPFLERENLTEERLFEGIRTQLEEKFGKLGQRVVDDNYRVIRRGFDEVREVPALDEEELVDLVTEPSPASHVPTLMDVPNAAEGIGNPGRFFEQVCGLCLVGEDVIADPFTAISAMPAASSTIRDMTDIRFEVPDFVADRCTGCSQCWVQCPDAAIPGLVNTTEDVWNAAIDTASNGRSLPRISQLAKPLASESQKLLKGMEFHGFGEVASAAYRNVVAKLGWDADRRAQLDEEFAAVYSILSELPLAKTVPFFDVPESKEKGSGGLLSITINPETCKGCNICVDVCPEEALITVKQDTEIVDRLRRNWELWQLLPDTHDRYINIRDLEEGIGVLPSLLLKKINYRSMVGGDGACMGCGEKTAVHLVTSTVEALVQPRVEQFVTEIDGLIAELDAKARGLLAADADLDVSTVTDDETVDVPLTLEKRDAVAQLADSIRELKDLRWRYTEGPGGHGRASLGITNSTGCSSVWGSTYPYNPYPFPWVNHLFQDAPSIAIGIFDGHMRKMADAFVAVRRARLLIDDAYDPEEHDPFFEAFDWQQFSDDEFALCPPILSIGGDGAMLDIGFQNLSRLMASGKPIRVMVLDTQVYSNTGGQACTSGYTGQVADMSAYGAAQHGKQEVRKELSLIALAHRGVFVHQSSQASPSHMIAGIIKGLRTRRPAVFSIYTPCPVEHGLSDEWAPHAARLALESRAFPLLTYDPDGGQALSDCLDLMGNPAVDDRWPMYELEHVDDEGETQRMELPLTIADWAATETRFKKHFSPIHNGDEEAEILFHEYLDLPADEREDRKPFVYTIDDERKLAKLAVSPEIAELAEERLLFWSQLRELGGLDMADTEADLEAEFSQREAQLRGEYEAQLAKLRADYPRVIARRLAEGLIRGGGDRTVADLLATAEATPGLEPIGLDVPGVDGKVAPAPAAVAQPAAAPVAAEPAPAVEEEEEEGLVIEPSIETLRCTSCNECTDLNAKMFAYDDNKQAYIKDPRAGTFAELVMAAERCPADIIHPGTPLNPKEKNLDKWIARAAPYN